MIKVTIDNEEVVSNQTFEIKEDMLSASSTILNNCFPKLWEEDHDYISRFYFPKDYSQCNISDVTTVTPIEGLTATGKSLNINYDKSLECELELLKGDTYQETYSGKNLLELPNTQTINGITFTKNNDGTFNLSGTATANADFVVEKALDYISTGYYTASVENTGYQIQIAFYNNNSWLTTPFNKLQQEQTKTSNVASIPSNANKVRLVIRVSNGVTINLQNEKAQLEKSSTATEYEKYVGGIPSPNPDYPQAIETVTGRQDIYVCGKNLFDINSITIGKILNTGTGLEQNSDNNHAITDFIQVDNTKPYMLSGILGTATLSEIYVFYYDANNEYIGATINRGTGNLGELEYNIRSYTGYSRAKYIRIRIDDLNNLNNLQLEKGNIKTNYEPYQGTTYEINLGKNLFDKNNVNVLNAYFAASVSTITSNSANRIIYVPCKPNTTYTIRKINSAQFAFGYTKELPANGVSVYEIHTSVKTLDTNNGYMTLTTGADAKYLVCRMYQTAQDTTITFQQVCDTIQIETGSQATTYAPYKTPIKLCKIGDARDYIYKFNNKWYLHKEIGKVTLDGSGTVNKGGTTLNNYYNAPVLSNYVKPVNNNQIVPHFTNYFINKAPNNLSGGDVIGSAIRTDNAIGFAFGLHSEINTVAKCKTWLSTHNVDVYYQLATPTETEITDEELIAQLNAFDLYNGINNIEIISPNLSGDIQIHYNFRTGSVTTKEIFTGVVKNTGNISLNPRDPKYCSLQILSYDTFLSEGKILDYVISNKKVSEAVIELINKISDYGVEVGFIDIPANQDVTIEAYSTLNQSPYDVFQYLSEISATHWTTEYSNGKVKIYYYANEQEGGPGLSYEYNYDDLLKDENVLDISWNLNTRDYRNRQIIKSNKVYSSITTIDNIYANGYETTFTLTQPVGKIETILVNGIAKTFATKKQQELGIYADFYYEVDKNIIESSDLYVNGSEIVVTYYAIIEGRQAINNASEVDRITTSTGINGTIERYETRNDVNSSSELIDIANTYLQYKGSPEITLTIKTVNDDLKIQVGNYVTYLMPSFPELQGKYLCKAKKTSITKTGESGIAFYEMTLTSSENVESAINYFDNQRRKVESNISAGDFITRNIDINNTALIKFQNTQVTEISTTGDNVLNCGLNAPLVK